jgi:hypothetical protein
MNTRTTSIRDDLFTVIAVATLAVCTTDFSHEAAGHGSACLMAGQHIMLLNNAFFKCSAFGRYTAAAGPLGNLIAGLIAFAAQPIIPRRWPALRFYALLVMAFSLFWEAGYLIQAMINDSGDSVFAYRELIGPENLAVRAAAVVVGLAAYFLFARMVMVRCNLFASTPGRLRRLLRTSWLTGVAAMILAGSFYAPDRYGAIRDAGLSILASFPLLFVGMAPQPPTEFATHIVRSPGVIFLALAVFVTFALTMGRGIVA